MVWDNKKKRQLIDRIEQTFETDAEYRQLLKVIQEYDIKFTENKNGCFIDLSRVDNTRALNQLQKVVKLCEEGKKYLEESTKAYNEAVKNH